MSKQMAARISLFKMWADITLPNRPLQELSISFRATAKALTMAYQTLQHVPTHRQRVHLSDLISPHSLHLNSSLFFLDPWFFSSAVLSATMPLLAESHMACSLNSFKYHLLSGAFPDQPIWKHNHHYLPTPVPTPFPALLFFMALTKHAHF